MVADQVLVPVALLLRMDHVFGTQISEQSDRGLLPARLPMLVERMVVIVHLVLKHVYLFQ